MRFHKPSELKSYLETLFKPGMTWNNYGQWELDHIIELSTFDLTNRDQFLLAAHYTNLQPLWKAEHHNKTAVFLSKHKV